MTDEEATETLIRIDERTARTEKTVDLLHHVLLEGNGTPSVTSQLATLTEKVEALEDADDGVTKKQAIGVGGLVAIIVGVINHFLG